MTNRLLQDHDGNTSSKRVAGYIIGGSGWLLLMAIGVVSIFKVIADPKTALAVGTTLVTTGAALLGIGVLEFLKPGAK